MRAFSSRHRLPRLHRQVRGYARTSPGYSGGSRVESKSRVTPRGVVSFLQVTQAEAQARNFLRSVLRLGKILTQNRATLRNALRNRNYELPGVSNDMQSSETLRNSLGLNYETAALPAELRRRERRKHYIPRLHEQTRRPHGSTKVSPISRSAMRSGALPRAAWKRSIGSLNGSKLSRNV
jgi:hypothetical protein